MHAENKGREWLKGKDLETTCENATVGARKKMAERMQYLVELGTRRLPTPQAYLLHSSPPCRVCWVAHYTPSLHRHTGSSFK